MAETKTIELARTEYRPDKMTYPAAVSLKLDGVPGNFLGSRLPKTRQDTDIKSVAHIQNWIVQHMPPGIGLVGELYDPTLKFKIISGQVRDTKQQFTNLTLNVFDLYVPDNPGAVFEHRTEALRLVLEDIAGKLGKQPEDLPVVRIPQIIVQNEDQARDAHDAIMHANPDAEGTMLAALCRVWSPGQRLWTLQKCKPEPTIDVEIIGFQEATSNDTGEPLGRVGRLVAVLHRMGTDGKLTYSQIGIGPGKLSHKEAKQLWLDYKAGKYKRRIAEVKYMPDASYDALRQATFQRWRDDKSEADVLNYF
ncbi:DNA ligase [Rhizobium phage Paso]|uniref:DNA ligase n=1 Tax=Rhizobium phage Paso TaxID=2767574 RepID=A0A7L8G6M7_9CAUD|nr:DNA ligase [Rhizobium phage Paso]